MLSTKTLARIGGALYLVVAVGGGFSQLYARSSLIVPGSAAATATNITTHAGLFRAGFVADLVAFTFFLAVGLVMYALLKAIDPQAALAMLVLNAVSVGISALNMLNHLGALMVATDPRFADLPRSVPLLLLELHQQGYLIAQIFFGLFLLPLGYLVSRSGMFPRVLGVVLATGSAGYVAGVAIAFAAPSLPASVATDFGLVGGVAELVFLLWLLIQGAKS